MCWLACVNYAQALELRCLGGGTFESPDCDELVDHPVEMGTFTLASFNARGVPHHIAITGRHHCDIERLCTDLAVICETYIDMFGELSEMDAYLFQIMAVGNGHGGLEHRTSASLVCKRDDLPQHHQVIIKD